MWWDINLRVVALDHLDLGKLVHCDEVVFSTWMVSVLYGVLLGVSYLETLFCKILKRQKETHIH